MTTNFVLFIFLSICLTSIGRAEHGTNPSERGEADLKRLNPKTVRITEQLKVEVNGIPYGSLQIKASDKDKKRAAEILNARIQAIASVGGKTTIDLYSLRESDFEGYNSFQLLWQNHTVHAVESGTKSPNENWVDSKLVQIKEDRLSITFEDGSKLTFPNKFPRQYGECLKRLLKKAQEAKEPIQIDAQIDINTYGFRKEWPRLSTIIGRKYFTTLEQYKTTGFYLINKDLCGDL